MNQPTARSMMLRRRYVLDRIRAALEVGADEYVMKPFTPRVIQEKLELLGMTVAP